MNSSGHRKNIRASVTGIVRNGDKILIAEGFDSVKKEVFFRLLGGGIEFGYFEIYDIKDENVKVF